MARSVVLLLLGAIAGSAGVNLLGAKDDPLAPISELPSEPAFSPTSAVSEPDLRRVSAVSAAQSFASERLAVYTQAAAADDPFELESLIRSTLAESESRSRDLKLTALLSRLAELGPRRAIDFARSQYLETKFFVPLYEIWAGSEPDAAIADLAGLARGAQQRLLALTILDVIGNNREGVDRVASVLPPDIQPVFRADALIARGTTDPAGAVAEALELDDALGILQSYILTQLSLELVRNDPSGALAMAESIDDFARRESFRALVLSRWAELDPAAAFGWVENASSVELSNNAAIIYTLAQAEPERMLAIIDDLPAGLRQTAVSAAMQGLASQDPEAAKLMVDSLQPGQERDQLISAIAQSLAQTDPEQALAWARSLVPVPQNAIRSVLQQAVMSDPNRGVELVLNELESAGPGDASSIVSSLSMVLTLGSLTGQGIPDMGPVLDRVIAMDNPTLDSMLSSMVGNWARNEPEAAFSWAMLNTTDVDANTFRNIAQRIAESDLNRAQSMLSQVPADYQAGWVAGLAQVLVQQDPRQAVDLLNRLQGRPGYGSAFTTVAREMARTDPAAAAQMLTGSVDGLTDNELRSVASTIAGEWAGQQPERAAEWVASLEGSPLLGQAMSSVVQRWALTDADSARNWLLTMNRGPDRDTALSNYLSVAVQTTGFQPDILDAFSTEQAAQQGMTAAITQIGRNDVEEARRLIDAYVQDDAMRRSLEDTLARTGGSGGGNTIITSGGFVVL